MEISSVSLIDIELIYRSEEMKEHLIKDLAALAALPNVRFVALTLSYESVKNKHKF